MQYYLIAKFSKYIFSNWIPIILFILSIYDLRLDFRLLLDFFTFSSLIYTIIEHPLAITVLITMPILLKSYNND